MEDEKQHVRDLLKLPYSKQALAEARAAFKDLRGQDRRALLAEFQASPLGKNFENLSRQLTQATKKLAPQLEAVAGMDWKKMIIELGGKAHASIAGINSGKSRRDEAEETWRTHALNLAITIRGKDKGITQINLAAKIKSSWTLKIHCPESQLISAISQWEREGKLPRRNTR